MCLTELDFFLRKFQCLTFILCVCDVSVGSCVTMFREVSEGGSQGSGSHTLSSGTESTDPSFWPASRFSPRPECIYSLSTLILSVFLRLPWKILCMYVGETGSHCGVILNSPASAS